MPAFNSDSVIKESIESVLGQTHTNFELIICDDLSTDNTKEIIKKYVEIDQRIKLVNNIFKKVLQVLEIVVFKHQLLDIFVF